MFNYYFDTAQYTEVLQYVSLFLLFVIGTMIYYMSTNSEQMNEDIKDSINNLDLECPKCPDHPNIPACPECPSLECNGNSCPECPVSSADSPKNGDSPKTDCPKCPDVTANCPSVDDIISGIFPGRNPGITSGGKYFDIMASENYELLPSYDFYNPVDAFPDDSILSAPDSLLKGNVDVPPTEIDNTISGNYTNTSPDVSLSRMNMSSLGANTGPSTLSGSSAFGSDTTRVQPDPTAIDERESEARIGLARESDQDP